MPVPGADFLSEIMMYVRTPIGDMMSTPAVGCKALTRQANEIMMIATGLTSDFGVCLNSKYAV